MLIPAMRFILALAALVVALADPPLSIGAPVYTYVALGSYLTFSIAIYLLARFEKQSVSAAIARGPWVDVFWYSLLIALTAGASSMYFSGLYFCVMVASFRWGFRSGLKVSFVSALIFALISWQVSMVNVSGLELNRLMLRTIWLLVLGYLMSYWGEAEIQHRRRLALLKEVTMLANPCLGIDRTVGSSLERLRAFYGAASCLLLDREPDSDLVLLRRADSRVPDLATKTEEVPAALAERLLGLPEHLGALYQEAGPWRKRIGLRGFGCDVVSGETTPLPMDRLGDLAAFLGAESFVTVPVRCQDTTAGRLYLTGSRRAFRRSDVAFVQHVVEQLMPVIHNIRLVEHLVQYAAEDERERIARDIHDSVVQPYIGLQMGISALGQTVDAGETAIRPQIDRLLELTRAGLMDLRGYIRGLKAGGEQEGSLWPAIRRYAEKFSEATGIAVQVETEGETEVHDRLVTEAFQMVTEALSNIRKHTMAKHAVVRCANRDGSLVMEIENDCADGRTAPGFLPRTIAGRAAALGGYIRVERRGEGRECVVVSIPL